MNAGRALNRTKGDDHQRHVPIRMRIRRVPTPGGWDEDTHIDAIDWNTARFTTNIPMRVDSEKFAASIGDGPLW